MAHPWNTFTRKKNKGSARRRHSGGQSGMLSGHIIDWYAYYGTTVKSYHPTPILWRLYRLQEPNTVFIIDERFVTVSIATYPCLIRSIRCTNATEVASFAFDDLAGL